MMVNRGFTIYLGHPMTDMPAYMRIRNYVVDLVLCHADPNVRIMSERELCDKFSVTRPTARKAIKELIDDGWLTPRPGFGTFINPAKAWNNLHRLLKLRKIIVLFNDGKLVEYDSFYMNILARICDTLKGLSVRMKLANLSGKPSEFLRELSAYNPDGILWMTPPDSYRDAIGKLRSRFPVHIIGCVPDGSPDSTTIDYHMGGRLAAAWLLDQGRRRITFIGYRRHQPTMRMFYDGWLSEFKERGVSFDESLRIDNEEEIIEVLAPLLKSGRIDGVFCYGYVFAFLDKALIRSGISTKSLSILIDEYQLPNLSVTTSPDAALILHPPELLEFAAKRLFQSLDENGSSAELVLKPRIKER